MRQVVSLFLPTWPTDRLRRRLGRSAPPPDAPLILAGMEGQRRVITAANAAARMIGLHIGMAVTQAQALVPDLLIMDAEEQADREGLERLAVWSLRRYAPIIAVDPPDGLMLDITGAAYAHGGVLGLLKDMAQRLAEVETAGRAVCAPAYGAAHALARYGADPLRVIDPLDLEEAIADLPLAALRLDQAIVSALSKLGLETIADLEAMPRASLALRFGSMPGLRLDQAYGRVAEPFELVAAPQTIEVERRFAEPIGAPETLAGYTHKLVEGLCQQLEEAGVGARRLDLRFHRVDNRIEAIRAGLAKPSRDRKQMGRLLCDRIETINPGFGVEKMLLSAPLVEPLGLRTISHLGETTMPDVAALVDILGNRVGEERLFRVAARESDIPERSVTRIPPMADPTLLRWPERWPRPARLFRRPEPIDTMALLPDHPPVHFVWRGMRRKVKRADGPERIYGEWHVSDEEWLSVRDYFLVEDETGARYWVFRQGDGMDSATGGQGWFLHGLFA
ncbi:DNA polymerase Y family protein (plasmid) [Sphingobium sp. V4]|uniref:Y-family DNA polymerase n=1 Tax=Sphingobium sp. V4 TaxID=3038927 RepID=UPI0025580FD9|nr:DNA polymerase Y family protein [Sphingobium sp. V4]WIW90373.1 DNA polymerase Y family protein [Sphingobium sp. V4]